MTNNSTFGMDNIYFHRTDNKTCSNSTQHYHSGFEIYFMKEGKCHYFIDDTSIDIVSGDVVLIPALTTHATTYGSKPCSRWLINVDSSMISSTVLSALSNVGYLYRNPKTVKHVENVFELIETEYNRGDYISPTAIASYIESLLIMMIRYGNEKSLAESNTIVQATIRYIHENYSSQIRLSQIAKKLSVSEEHLSRTFKKEMSFGFSEYLTLIRLQKAEHMLKNEPSRAITEVAYACGFNDSNYFSYKFKKAYGLTPSEVRDGNNAPERPSGPNNYS